ncbi:MAG TPA: hypothetical protein VFC39_21880 [Acidobacteriaceae bacterium]|nr:hypothetical protein [Acidobacteriaceae bacterium]
MKTAKTAEYALDFSHAQTIQEVAERVVRNLYSGLDDKTLAEMIEYGKTFPQHPMVDALNAELQNLLERR